MNTSGDAAEQIVRLSLEGFEVIARITGSGAKEALAMIYAVLKDNEQQSVGKTNLINMLRTCKNIKIFSMPKEHLEKFVKESKKYGILYCTLLDKNAKSADSVVDIMVRGEDAARMNRIIQRYKLPILDTAELNNEKDKVEEKANDEIQISNDVIDDILGDNEVENDVIDDILGDKENEKTNEIDGFEMLTEQNVIEITREDNGVSNDFLEVENQLEHSLKNKGEINNEKVSVMETIQKIIKDKFTTTKEEHTKEREEKQEGKSKNKKEKNKKGKGKKYKNKKLKGEKKNGRAR